MSRSICKNGSLRNIRKVPELQGQGSGQVVVRQVPARGAPRGVGSWERWRRKRRMANVSFPVAPPPTPALCDGSEAGGCRALRRRSQSLQIGEKPELRWDAAGQVVVVQAPARRGWGRSWGRWRRKRRAGGLPLSAPAPRCDGSEVGVPSCGGAHRSSRSVSSPSCGGTLPVRSL